MKRTATILIATCFLSQILFTDPVVATETINVSGWDIEIQEDGTCSLGKIYELGGGASLIVVITSYGQISIITDKAFDGKIAIDNKNTVTPVMIPSSNLYMYSNSDNLEHGRLLIKYFIEGNSAEIILKDGGKRTLSLKGFSRAYERYVQCAR